MNIEKANESLYRKGFGKELSGELEQKVKSGNPEIELIKVEKIGEDEASYKIQIKNDVENKEIYINKIAVALKLPGGEVLEHTFSADRMITAMEAYRMIKFGDRVSVNKDLFKDGEKYNTWLSLATDQPKDEFGNYQYNSYHENYYKKYPFDVKEQLDKVTVPVRQLEVSANFEGYEKSLKKANLIPVTIMVNGEETAGFLGVNPEKGKVVVYDNNLELVEGTRQEQGKSQTNEATPQNEEVKKKPWDEQKVDWKKNKSKGQSI